MYTADGEELINSAELARRLNVDPSAVRRYEQTGKIVPYSVSYRGLRRVTLFRASEVDRLKRMRRQGPEDTQGNSRPAMLVAAQA